ncbi:MAG TPA: MarR family transcriptional regulator [Mycobacteriales bacterium]|jgi:DNA-binding MarR family transcriptional regulator
MDEDVAIRLRQVITKLARQLNVSSTGEGLTPSQASVLGLVVGRGPLSISELTDLEGLNPTMTSRVLGVLDTMGLIERTPDPSDLRSASITATQEGRRRDERIKARRAAVVSAAMDRLPAAQQKAITAALPALEALRNELARAVDTPPAGAARR